MSNPLEPQSQKRTKESVAALFTADSAPKSMLFLKSSSDIGVMRNGGRNGARFAPTALLNTFKKLSLTETHREYKIVDLEVASQEEEKADFAIAQMKQAARIKAALTGGAVVHIGGGHDHIFPFLMAASEQYSHVVVLNIDAHADTRTDDNHHSGTPFRQFAQKFPGTFSLYQYGLHRFANTLSTLSPLPKKEMDILWKDQLHDQKLRLEFFSKLREEVKEKTLFVFSLDADALTANEVPGVSAVNSDGLTLKELKEVWKEYVGIKKSHAPMVGIYELNPLYDTLSGISMRTISNFLFDLF
jgi:formiminoglutamase